MKKKVRIIVVSIIVVLIIVLLGVQYYFNQETEKLKKYGEMLNTQSIETKTGEIIETEYFNFDDGNFFIKLPKSFSQMDEETLKIKYPNENPPTYAFSNDATTVSVAISLSEANMKNRDIANYLKTMEKTFSSVYEDIETKISELEGHKIGQMKFISPAVDTKIYNHMLVFSDQNKLRIVNFNCTEELKDDWEEVGDFIINSLMFPTEK